MGSTVINAEIIGINYHNEQGLGDNTVSLPTSVEFFLKLFQHPSNIPPLRFAFFARNFSYDTPIRLIVTLIKVSINKAGLHAIFAQQNDRGWFTHVPTPVRLTPQPKVLFVRNH